LPEKFSNGPQQQVRDWFDSFDLSAAAVNWTVQMKASYLGLFLAGAPLTVWRTQCSRVDYEAAKALLIRTFDGTPHPDMALKRFNAYQWDRKIPVLEFVANAHKLLCEYNDLLPPDRRLSPDATQSLLIDKVTEYASGGARAEMRRARPTTLAEACDLLAVYSDDAPPSSVGAVAAVSPLEDKVRDEMVLKAINDGFSRGFEKVADVLETFVKKVQDVIQVQPTVIPGAQPPHGLDPGSCGSCQQQDHGTLSCPFEKFDKGCAICGTEGHLARACPRNPFLQLISTNANDKEAAAGQ
ncbi:hypothetical protein FOL46_009507, partial [Perkinsus olseni]